MMAAIRDVIEQHLTRKQRQVLRALVFEDVPLGRGCPPLGLQP